MKKENMLIASIKRPFLLIKKNKALLFIILVMQIIFLSLLFLVSLEYATKIGQSASAILNYAEAQDVDETSVTTKLLKKESVLGEDPLLIYREAQNIIGLLKLFTVYFLLIFVIFNGISWALTDNLLNKKGVSGFFGYLWKFGVVTLAYSLVLFLFLRGIISSSSLENIQLYSFLPILAIFYFMFISFALIGKNSLKDAAKKTFILGIKKGHILILAYLINAVIIGLPSVLLAYSLELNLFALLAASLLSVFSFVYARIFLIAIVDRLDMSRTAVIKHGACS